MCEIAQIAFFHVPSGSHLFFHFTILQPCPVTQHPNTLKKITVIGFTEPPQKGSDSDTHASNVVRSFLEEDDILYSS
jgi:hypothetical protein